MTLRNRRGRRATLALAGLTATAFALGACGTEQAGPEGGSGKINVVASTSVWGSIAQTIGGDAVEVEALIDDANADPHSYESTPQDAAKVGDADLVVFNGGGYDEFIEQLRSSNGGKTPAVQAVQGGAAGHEPGHGSEAGHDHSGNEHVWYDLHVAHETAERIADELGKLRPESNQQFHDAAARFTERVSGMEKRVEQIATTHHGKPVIVTEPVAHYLVEQAQLRDITPGEFVRAVEAGNDPSAMAVAEIQNAVNSRQAAALVYNPQTASPVTERIRKMAEQNQIPVVEMTETLPENTDYAQWMDSQISALENALNRKP